MVRSVRYIIVSWFMTFNVRIHLSKCAQYVVYEISYTSIESN
jgi:hypothetical protein